MGTRHRLTGVLMRSPRGLVLSVEGGGTYALDAPSRALRLIGRRVVVEAVRSGFDRIDVERIDPASP
jgi:hypothetical protein